MGDKKVELQNWEDEEKYSLRFLITPRVVYKDSRLSKLDSHIISFIYSYTGKTFSFGNKRLAKMFEVTPSAVSKSISRIRDYGYIDFQVSVQDNGTQIRKIHKLFDDINELGGIPTGTRGFPEELGDSQRDRGGVPAELHKDNISKDTIIINNNSASDLASLEDLGLIGEDKKTNVTKEPAEEPEVFGNEGVNALLGELDKFSKVKVVGKNYRRYAMHIYNGLNPLLKNGKVKKGKEWLDKDWRVNLGKFLQAYQDRFDAYRYLTVDKVYYNVFKPWQENQGNIPRSGFSRKSTPKNNLPPSEPNKYSDIKYNDHE